MMSGAAMLTRAPYIAYAGLVFACAHIAHDKPFKSSNTTTFTFTPDGDGTHVKWTMTGPRPLFMRIFGFLFNMDKLVGKDFEKGLRRLAAAAISA